MVTIKLCECGCGLQVNKEENKYVLGHNHRGRTYEEIYGDLVSEKKEKRRIALEGKKREDMVGENNPAKKSDIRKKIKDRVKISWNYPGNEKRRQLAAELALMILPGKGSSIEAKKKKRKTMEDHGLWAREEDIDSFEIYYRRVRIFTDASIKEKYSQEELNSRGRDCGYKQIDHIFSIIQGFIQGILPMIIGSKSNIRLIDAEENWFKHDKCYIDKYELFRKYDEELKGNV
jgi:hypothetical protein